MRFKEFYKLINESVLKDGVALIGVLTNACTRISEVQQFTAEEVNAGKITDTYFEPPVGEEDALQYDVSLQPITINTDPDLQHAIERAITTIMDMVIGHGEEDSLSEYEVSNKLKEGFSPFFGKGLKGWWIASGSGFFGIVLNQSLTHLDRKIRSIRDTEDITGLEDLF
jgi:hypothetical protein